MEVVYGRIVSGNGRIGGWVMFGPDTNALGCIYVIVLVALVLAVWKVVEFFL